MEDSARDPRRLLDLDLRALSTADLVALLRSEPADSDPSRAAVMALHLRGGVEEFAAGEALSRSERAEERLSGADVLAQLGAGQPTFVEESVALLLGLLSDPDERVVGAAGVALGHRRSAAAIPPLLALVAHPSASVRHGVAHGIMWSDAPEVIDALIALSRDPDRDVRDWSTLGLQLRLDETDTPALRDALFARTDDDDPEVRGEALIGLAQCRDPRVLPALRRELAGEFHGDWCVEAVERFGDASLGAALAALRARLGPADEEAFGRRFDEAAQALAAIDPTPE
ncbi:MAG: hypothetical protein JWM10_4422 [Myxococcaceae bacterium]|nr:hypothetical protein [Myxococcaceae bacterium]